MAAVDLVAKIRKAREFRIEIDSRRSVVARRPTDAEFFGFAQRGSNYSDIAADCVVDWSGFTEDDLIGGGGSDPVKFDARLWREWISDRQSLWEKFATAILESYNEHREKQEDETKNSALGSS